MRVGVVIVNFNGSRYVGNCLQSLRRQSCTADAVFVIDNASTDGSADLIAAKFPEVTLVRSPANVGFAGGVNVGIRQCQERGQDAVLILNPDTVMDVSALEMLIAATNRHPLACLTPLVVRADRPDVVASYAGEIVWWRGRVTPRYLGRAARDQPDSDVRVEMANGACVLLPLVAVRKVGLFDESYFLYFEDVDYFERLGRGGFESWYVPSARVLHAESSATGGRTSRVGLYYFIRNRHRFVRKFKSGQPVYAAFLTYAALDVLYRTVRLSLHGGFGLAGAVIRATLDAWNGKLGPETPAPPGVAHQVGP